MESKKKDGKSKKNSFHNPFFIFIDNNLEMTDEENKAVAETAMKEAAAEADRMAAAEAEQMAVA